jgi:Flp pilus assembly pilin Flp
MIETISKAWAAASRMLSRLRDRDGQALVEYTLILVFVSTATMAALLIIGGKAQAVLTNIANAI